MEIRELKDYMVKLSRLRKYNRKDFSLEDCVVWWDDSSEEDKEETLGKRAFKYILGEKLLKSFWELSDAEKRKIIRLYMLWD